MPPEQFVSNVVQAALLLVIAAGLCARDRVSLCWSFLLYVVAVLASTCLVTLWYAPIWTFSFFVAKETTFAVLKIVIALEIWQRNFCSFPRARVRVGLVLAGSLAAVAISTARVPEGLNYHDALVGILNPRHQAGALALYAIIVLAGMWYRVPLHPFHRAIVLGFAFYQAVHTLSQTVFIVTYGARAWVYPLLFTLEAVAYPATLAWWGWAAWRPVRSPSPIVSRLQPWAHSW